MQGDSIFFKVKQGDVVPDKYGKHFIIKMISAYTAKGEFVRHIKLNDKSMEMLKDSWIIPSKEYTKENIIKKEKTRNGVR
tara:strand:- start:349 stop:588 length:240 start_codon:yes stop_codon:yes gene_type:complete